MLSWRAKSSFSGGGYRARPGIWSEGRRVTSTAPRRVPFAREIGVVDGVLGTVTSNTTKIRHSRRGSKSASMPGGPSLYRLRAPGSDSRVGPPGIRRRVRPAARHAPPFDCILMICSREGRRLVPRVSDSRLQHSVSAAAFRTAPRCTGEQTLAPDDGPLRPCFRRCFRSPNSAFG